MYAWAQTHMQMREEARRGHQITGVTNGCELPGQDTKARSLQEQQTSGPYSQPSAVHLILTFYCKLDLCSCCDWRCVCHSAHIRPKAACGSQFSPIWIPGTKVILPDPAWWLWQLFKNSMCVLRALPRGYFATVVDCLEDSPCSVLTQLFYVYYLDGVPCPSRGHLPSQLGLYKLVHEFNLPRTATAQGR